MPWDGKPAGCRYMQSKSTGHKVADLARYGTQTQDLTMPKMDASRDETKGMRTMPTTVKSSSL